MPRPVRCRRIGFLPGVTYYKPAGVPLRVLEEVRLALEELEALRLCELEGLEQEAAAGRMGISRPTFQRVLQSARFKIADALVNGRAIRVHGGNYTFSPETGAIGKEEHTMKIAAVTEDGVSLSQHFGRAPWYVVLAVENGKVVSREKREKAGHHTFVAQGGHGPHGGPAGAPHGFDTGAGARHRAMVASITDCQVVLAGGMGWGAFENLKQKGLQVVVTDVENIDEAVKRYLEGRLPNLMERLH